LFNIIEGSRILVTGGTGSLGKVLIRRLLELDIEEVTIFSRDEAKQYFMGKQLNDPRVKFRLGDIRNYRDVAEVIQRKDIVFNAAALKQVPNCEHAPFQAVQTNVIGAENIVSACSSGIHGVPEVVVGISTDKAPKPCNVMGMTKALQERIFIHGNTRRPLTRFICTRYGNVLASRGSLVPVFNQLAIEGKPLTVTSDEMTRFLMNLDEAVDLILLAVKEAQAGELFIPRVKSGRIIDIATIFAEHSQSKIEIMGVRPGEKLHEILISEEEARRTVVRDDVFIVKPDLDNFTSYRPELPAYGEKEFSSSSVVMGIDELRDRLNAERLLPGQFDFNRFN